MRIAGYTLKEILGASWKLVEGAESTRWYSFRTRDFRDFVHLDPVVFEQADQSDNALKIRGFDQKGVGAKLIGAVHVVQA